MADAPRNRFGCALATAVCVLILAALAAFAIYRFEHTAESVARQVRDAFVAVTGLQPRISVHDQVVFTQSRPALELAVMENDSSVDHEFESTWMGSTKTLRVRGQFHIKFGYNLQHDFAVNVLGNRGETVQLTLPPPRVLSVELIHLDVLTLDNGLWNHLTKDELADEINAATLEAHAKASGSDLPEEAQRQFIARLQEKVGLGHHVEIVSPPLAPRGTPAN